MAIFKTKAVLLDIRPEKDSSSLLVFFTREYGKITLRERKNTRKKNIDIGYLFSVTIHTSPGKKIPSLREIETIKDPLYNTFSYEHLDHYQNFLGVLYKNLYYGNPEFSVFDIFEYYCLNIDSLSLEKKRLLELKVLLELHILEYSAHPTIQKIYNFLASNTIESVIKLTGLSDEIYLKILGNISKKKQD